MLKEKIRELNRKRNFAFKKIKLQLRFSPNYLMKLLIRTRFQKCDLSAVKKILIIRNDRIGDMVVTTALIRNMANAGYDVYVSSRKASLDIIKFNPHVSRCIIYDDSSIIKWFKSILNIRKEHFDCAIEIQGNRCIDIKNILFCSYVRTPILVGVNKSNIKSFNQSLNYYQPDQHITSLLYKVLNEFNINSDDMHYELFVSDNIKNKAMSFLNSIQHTNKRIIILNPFGSTKDRWMTNEQIRFIYDTVSSEQNIIIIIGEKNKINQIDIPYKVLFFDSESILSVIPLIEESNLVISVDTAIVHIASCYQRNTIAMYTDTLYRVNEKNLYQQQFDYFKSQLSDYFYDKKYIIENHPNRSIAINQKVWSPNNINAQQIVFDHNVISEIRKLTFEKTLTTAINNFYLKDTMS